jgi:hypothetical protein
MLRYPPAAREGLLKGNFAITFLEDRMNKGIVHTQLEQLESRQLLSTTAAPYLVPSAPGVTITPLMTTGESAANGYRMVGIPDGLGAYDNGDGTFTVLMNHELRNTQGINRAHGNKGAFVSKWIISKSTGEVLSGQDQIKKVFLYDPATSSYVNAAPAFNRFCSANLAEQSAFYNPASGLGTKERIFTNGEEAVNGRAMAHIVSSGESFELAAMGNYAFENVVANPYPQNLTIVAAQDDSSRLFTSEGAGTGTNEPPSEVYFYIGHKQKSGSIIDKAGLTNGMLHGLKVAKAATEAEITSGDRFRLVNLGDVSADNDVQLEAESIDKGVTQFRRPEDGAWDPTNPNIYYFVTTDIFDGDTRLWKLTFDDITDPAAGGKIEIAIDSPAGTPAEMFDNIAVDKNSNVVLLEDVGNNKHLGAVWERSAGGTLTQVAAANPDLFDPNLIGPGVKGPNFLTQDEEASGVIDMASILGPGWFMLDEQAHFTNTDPELVEGGQLLLMHIDGTGGTTSPQSTAASTISHAAKLPRHSLFSDKSILG